MSDGFTSRHYRKAGTDTGSSLHVGASGFDYFPMKLSPGAVPLVAAVRRTEEEVSTLPAVSDWGRGGDSYENANKDVFGL